VFFDTLKSVRSVGFVHRCEQAHERRLCVSRAKARGEKSSKGRSKAERGSADESWVKPPRRERTYQVHESLSYATIERAVGASSSSERGVRMARGDVKATLFGAALAHRSLGRCQGVVLRNVADVSSGIGGRIGLKGQSAVRAVPATGRGKPLRVSIPRAELA
jgi:hypothetical protein